jgi:PAS domain S-box-containing protein
MPKFLEFENNHDFLEILFKSIEEGLIITTKERDIVYVNKRALELFDFEYAELVGEKIELLIPMKYHGNHSKHVENYAKKPERKRMGAGRVLEAQKKDGSTFFSEISLNHIDIKDKKYFVALITDVSKRVEAENKIKELNTKLEEKVSIRTKELEKSKLLYTAVAQNFPNGTINVFDKNLNYIFAEGKELLKYGVTSKKLIGTSYLERLPKGIRQNINTKLQKVFEGEKVEFEIQIESNFFSLSAVPLFNSLSVIDSILVVETNITTQKRSSQKLKDSLIKEKEINEMKSNFVSMASHEFRTPLSTILSSVSIISTYIKKGKLDGTEKHIKRIKNSVNGLTSILNDFLSTDKLESKKVEANLTIFNYSTFKKDITEELQALCKQDQTIISSINKEHIEVKTDQNIIKNILYNLVSNAIKYSEEEQDIIINSVIEKNELTIEVLDFGIGIPENEQKNLFNRFFRAKNTVNIKGTGLGLNIVQSYLDLLHGSITFDSEENSGTRFTVKIPLEL